MRAEIADKRITFRVAMKPGTRRALPNTPDGRLLDLVKTVKAHIRAKVEQPFHAIKVNELAALMNLYIARGCLLATK